MIQTAQSNIIRLYIIKLSKWLMLTMPILKNHINEISPSEIRATVLSIRSLIIRLAFVILGPLLGWQADRAGLPSSLVAGAGFFLVTGLLSAFFLIHTFRKNAAVPDRRFSNPKQHVSGL